MLNDELKKMVVTKLISTAISLKFWALVVITIVSVIMLYLDKLTGMEWVILITSIYSIIFSVREIFKAKNMVDITTKKIQETDEKLRSLKKSKK